MSQAGRRFSVEIAHMTVLKRMVDLRAEKYRDVTSTDTMMQKYSTPLLSVNEGHASAYYSRAQEWTSELTLESDARGYLSN